LAHRGVEPLRERNVVSKQRGVDSDLDRNRPSADTFANRIALPSTDKRVVLAPKWSRKTSHYRDTRRVLREFVLLDPSFRTASRVRQEVLASHHSARSSLPPVMVAIGDERPAESVVERSRSVSVAHGPGALRFCWGTEIKPRALTTTPERHHVTARAVDVAAAHPRLTATARSADSRSKA
jgi:hypothetical protein